MKHPLLPHLLILLPLLLLATACQHTQASHEFIGNTPAAQKQAEETASPLASVGSADSLTALRLQVINPAGFSLDPASNGTIREMNGENLFLLDSPLDRSLTVRVFDLLTTHKEIFRLQDPAGELLLATQVKDSLGITRLRFTQVRERIPVLGAEVSFYVSSSGALTRIIGHYYPSLATGSVDLAPSVSLDTAFTEAYKRLNVLPGEGAEKHEGRLVLFPAESRILLCWELSISPTLDDPWRFLIDAHTGALVRAESLRISGALPSTL